MLAATFLLVLAVPGADADVVVLCDGKAMPPVKDLPAGGAPNNTQLKSSGRSNLTLEYTNVRVGRKQVSAAQVCHV